MNEKRSAQVGRGYPLGRLARAFATARSHEDPEIRRRAEERVRRWERVLGGMAAGTLTIGSRAPVDGLPAWVTPEVVRGGFATGEAAAGGPPLPYEIETARRAGLPADRAALFAHHLTEAGLAELHAMLDGGTYDIVIPEEGALLTVAWLLRAGDRDRALELLDAIEPFAGRLRFTPRPAAPPPADDSAATDATAASGSAADLYRGSVGATMASRSTVGEVRDTLAARRPNAAIEAMREALTVWNPYADDLLAHWLETVRSGRVLARTPAGWRRRGAALLRRYERLAAEHTRCTKHRRPRENITILRSALADVVDGRPLTRPRRDRLQRRVDSMVARRGRPGSDGHAALRGRQSSDAARPTHHALAQLVLRRMSELPEESAVGSTEPLTGPVTEEERRATGIPAGAEIPPSLARVIERALSAPVETLIARGIVPSAEVLAALVPRIVASTTAEAYEDDALRVLMAAGYRAFRNRRSLLLLNLEHQVRLGELPWVRAVAPYRRTDGDARRRAHAALVLLGELALQGFPATILPNPLVSELAALAREAGDDIPLVDELAADIFMGTFSAKFTRAAKMAAGLLRGSLYERYYGIDHQAVLAIEDVAPHRRFRFRTPDTFESLCHARAGIDAASPGYSVAANGMVIEQAQILTTHNLATLVSIGVRPAPGWADLAQRSFTTACTLVTRLAGNPGNPYPLRAVKDAAYAWRQMIFYLAQCPRAEQDLVIDRAYEEIRRRPGQAAERLAPALAGLRHVAAGGEFAPNGTIAGSSATSGSADAHGRRFLGWTLGDHWILPPRRR